MLSKKYKIKIEMRQFSRRFLAEAEKPVLEIRSFGCAQVKNAAGIFCGDSDIMNMCAFGQFASLVLLAARAQTKMSATRMQAITSVI